MTRNLYIYTFIGFLMVFGAGFIFTIMSEPSTIVADTPVSNTRPPIFEEDLENVNTISSAISNNTSLSMLYRDIVRTNVEDLLNQENSNFTIFAPSNLAYERLGDMNLSDTQLIQLLESHVVPISLPSFLIENGSSITTINGEEIKINIVNGEIILSNKNYSARIITPDIITDNGTIHIVDQILLN